MPRGALLPTLGSTGAAAGGSRRGELAMSHHTARSGRRARTACVLGVACACSVLAVPAGAAVPAQAGPAAGPPLVTVEVCGTVYRGLTPAMAPQVRTGTALYSGGLLDGHHGC